MAKINKAIVIGAGPAGLATALHLHKTHNTQVTVYEIRTSPTTLGGAISIPANGLRLLDRLGVYNDIRAGGSITPEIIFHSTHGGLLGRLDLVSGIRQRIGFEYMRVKRTVLMDAMLKAVEAAGPGIEVRFGERVVDISENDEGTTVTAKFESGIVDTADILIGCDGIHSAVRSLYVNPAGAQPEYSGVASMSSIIKMPTDLEGLNFTITARGSMAVLPCVDVSPATSTKEKELFWFITRHIPAPSNAAEARDGWNEHRSKEVDGFKNTAQTFIQDVQGDWGDFLRSVIDHTQSVNFYPIYRLPRDDNRPWHRGRCVLVGDAAHAMSPHVGQGVSMALEDVFLLTRVLGPQPGDDNASLDDMLGRYERVRRPRVGKMAEQAASNAQASKVKSPWEMTIMEWSLWAWLWKSWVFKGLSWGLHEDDVAYDIDEADIRV